MAFNLNKTELTTKKEFLDVLAEVGENLKEVIQEYNTKLEDLQAPVKESLSDYNEVIQKVKEFCEGIASKVEDEWAEKSEKWQESDKGQLVSEWKDLWEGADFEELELDFSGALDSSIPENVTTLDDLPDEVAS